MTEIFSTTKFMHDKLHAMFVELGEELANKRGDDEDFVAGIPMAMFKAESYMRSAWANYLEKQDVNDGLGYGRTSGSTVRNVGSAKQQKA